MRICSGPGCGRKVAGDVRFCAECQPSDVSTDDGIREHARSKYGAELEVLNTTPRWRGIRKRVLQRDPICKRCKQQPSFIVDHIVPAEIAVRQVRDSGKCPFDKHAGYFLMSNLQGLCRPCHGDKTNEDKAHQGEWPSVVERDAQAPKKQWTF